LSVSALSCIVLYKKTAFSNTNSNVCQKNRPLDTDTLDTDKVKDEGIGILKENQQLIFERFGQVDNTLVRQAEGTGMGLSLVRLIAEAMGAEKKEDINNRLINSIATEFSDIYLQVLITL